jgi:hypothetical protein
MHLKCLQPPPSSVLPALAEEAAIRRDALNMLKITIYDGPGGSECSYIEGVKEPGGKRSVKSIITYPNTQSVYIEYENDDSRTYNGFRYIIDQIQEK